MSRTPGEKYVLIFEAAKRSLLVARGLLAHLAVDVALLQDDILRGVQIEERAVSPLLSAVTFVDFAHRFGSLVDALPLLKKRAPELRRLRTALEPVEMARNYLQHMRGTEELSSQESIDYPILGSLAWTNEDAGFLISFSQPTKTDTFSIAYDVQNRCWTAKHEYRVKSARINLDAVLSDMQAAYDWILTKVSISDPALMQLEWGKTQVVGFRFVIKGVGTIS